MKKYICEYCGKEFESKKKQRFCCRKCASAFSKGKPRSSNTKKVKVQCAECGKIEYVAPSRAKKYKCCSVECMGKYNSKRFSKKITLICPICGKKYECKQSKINHHRTCGDLICRKKWLEKTRIGVNNSNYKTVEQRLKECNMANNRTYASDKIYKAIVRDALNLSSISKLPKGWTIHHKDCIHTNNNIENLVMIPNNVHMLVHRWFGNILLNALHTGKIDRELFFSFCSNEQKEFYKQIIDLNITHQAVVKQGELLESPEKDNQQPSIYRNIIEGSTTNGRIWPDNAEDSNVNTSALPANSSDDIV